MHSATLIDFLLSNDETVQVEQVIVKSIHILNENVLVKAKFYEGDLLMTVLSVDKVFWQSKPNLWQKVIEILHSQEERIKNQQVSFEMKVDWYKRIDRFKLHN